MPFALALTGVLTLLAIFQIALALGAPWGRFAWGGTHRVLPTRLRVGSIIAVLIYAAIAVIAFARVGALAFPPLAFTRIAMWVVFGYSLLGVIMNALSRSRAERMTMTPVTVILALLSLPIAVGAGALALPVAV